MFQVHVVTYSLQPYLLCECGVPILGDGCIGDGCIGDGCIGDACIGDGCIGDILFVGIVPPGDCMIFWTDAELADGEIIGPGLFIGELCCVKGDTDADGDIIGDCEVLGWWIGDEVGGPNGEWICCRGDWPDAGRCLACCLFRYSFI